jgi:hypothetical protein
MKASPENFMFECVIGKVKDRSKPLDLIRSFIIGELRRVHIL